MGAAGHALPPVRGASHHRLQEGLQLWKPGSHEASQGCRRSRIVRGSAKNLLISCEMQIEGIHFFGSDHPPSSSLFGVCLAMEQYTMERGVVHACHAGGVVHYLEGWTHHEVGAIDVDRIDVVWRAALKHGLTPV
ncbi:hypothetical protein BHE74_00033912 [Ensete ventricosum]|nr:hypothetical protein GW17_00049098 [Ensete ventricosum]RWW59169.1 hypothetical protein BHE74_00033912 [Ensete ventricosum]